MENQIKPEHCAFSVPDRNRKGEIIHTCAFNTCAAIARKWGIDIAQEMTSFIPACTTRKPCTEAILQKCACFYHVPHFYNEPDMLTDVMEEPNA